MVIDTGEVAVSAYVRCCIQAVGFWRAGGACTDASAGQRSRGYGIF